MARPMRSKVRAFGRFSSHEIVDCEHSSRSDGDKSSAIFYAENWRRFHLHIPPRSSVTLASDRKAFRLCGGFLGKLEREMEEAADVALPPDVRERLRSRACRRSGHAGREPPRHDVSVETDAFRGGRRRA